MMVTVATAAPVAATEFEILVKIGVAVATYEAVAGCTILADRLNFRVFGAQVNLASRLSDRVFTMTIITEFYSIEALWGGDAFGVVLHYLKLKDFT